jgi:predicted Zn-dependent protease
MFLLRHDAFDEALELSTRTLTLDPTSPLSNRHRAQMLYAARRYDECIAVSRDTLLLDPHDVSLVLNWLPRCLEALGRRREAIEARVQSMAAHGAPARAARMMRLYSTRGWDAYWQEERRREDASDLKTALVSVRLGDHDTAIARLERLYEIRYPWLGFIDHAEWDPLRSDPRFQPILARAR